jgi:hypothetical protein
MKLNVVISGLLFFSLLGCKDRSNEKKNVAMETMSCEARKQY